MSEIIGPYEILTINRDKRRGPFVIRMNGVQIGIADTYEQAVKSILAAERVFIRWVESRRVLRKSEGRMIEHRWKLKVLHYLYPAPDMQGAA
jgi:hypothetical protein